ncbi:hypothetical protein M7I_7262 [Glarea lozoyensis 74030]|uniref:Neutral/alkaline non-lysosomal ceramidase N-terminal domain-containing protein n=1 Tax=Glarea lozoyensis (strain ATCC 74030 / MF5533) TaxID=1104152 RepID=H0EWT8_GLAL7|nr:hypothetical protein M7I_7262 [Glarea lozoyensis 74030]
MVGAARVDITPTPNSLWLPLNIYDNERLYVRAIVFNNDGVYGAFISCELAFIKDPIYKAANALVAAYLNTTTSNVIVSITHAHSAGPAGVTTANQYGNAALSTYPSVAEAALAAVEKALLVMRPAKVGYNTGSAYHNVNRDALNPLTGRWTQASNTSGPVDREVQVLTFLSTDATPEPLAAWTTIFSQQAAGDVNPLLRWTGTNNLASQNSIPVTGFELTHEPVEEAVRDAYVPFSKPDQHYIRQLFDELQALGIMVGEEVIRAMSLTSEWDSNPRIWSKQQNVTCPGRLRLDSAREGVQGTYTSGPDIDILTGVVGLGDIAVAWVGCEIFMRIGWRIKDDSSMNKTMLVAMSNGQSSSGVCKIVQRDIPSIGCAIDALQHILVLA